MSRGGAVASAADRAAAERSRRRRRTTPLLDVAEAAAEEAGERLADALEVQRLVVVRDRQDEPADDRQDEPADHRADEPVETPEPEAGSARGTGPAAGSDDAVARATALLAEAVEFVRRRLQGDYAVDEFGFDPELTERVFFGILRPVYRRWFRVECRGGDNLPRGSGALLVSNHSGTIAWDALMTQLAVHEATGGRFLRLLGADLVFATPLVGDVARRTGATLAGNEDAERLLSAGELVGVWPEGFKGIGKPFRDRYRLQRFGRGGFVAAAIRTGVPIVPVSLVGAEETYPMLADLRPLARLTGAPYWPVTPLFPWFGLLGLIPLPSKWLLEFGTPIGTDQLDTSAADDPMVVFEITDKVREVIQQTLYALLVQRRSVFLG